MDSKLILFVVILSLTVLAVHGKSKKKETKEKQPAASAAKGMVRTCLGQEVNITNYLSDIKECVDNKITEISAVASQGKKKKKNKKSKNKLGKKMSKKCAAECQWRTFGLIPNATESDENAYDLEDVDLDQFLELFPKAAHEALNKSIMDCYETSTIISLKTGKGINVAKQMCSQNKGLLKCFKKAVNRSCTGTAPSTPTPLAAAPGNNTNRLHNNSMASSPMPTSPKAVTTTTIAPEPPSTASETDPEEEVDGTTNGPKSNETDDDNEDDDDDEDDDDEEED